MERKLTKSRFKLGMECPVKLYYTRKPEYLNTNLDDPFLSALAEGGFQVGELAKLYYPAGQNITSLDMETALKETGELLKQEDVVIFEAAVLFEDLFIRIDILEKKGNKINLIEVKAKSISGNAQEAFFKKKGDLRADWSPYLYDAVFQKYVLQKAYPHFRVSAYLMLVDKDRKATVDGLNQRFLLQKDVNGRTSVKVTKITDPGGSILRRINIEDVAGMIQNTPLEIENSIVSFEEYIHRLTEAYVNDRKINHPVGVYCKKCEFNPDACDLKEGKKSGFQECWKEKAGFKDTDFSEQLVFELWSYSKKQDLLNNGIYFLKDIEKSYIQESKLNEGPGLSRSDRMLLQIQKVKNKDNTPYIDTRGIKQEMETWKFPLHFIDFETTMTAIPFNQDRKPYEIIAFQFSHHIVSQDGAIEHKGQYLNDRQGIFPNYDFIRALKKELENDSGSIFRYSLHENTCLNKIYEQLSNEKEIISDKKELLDFIKTITHFKDGKFVRRGERDMIDLWDIVKKYYYHPAMKGSNSIKAVLPAVLESRLIQDKYAQPVYGSQGGIKSLNYENWAWVKKDETGKIINPYHLLPPLFEGIDNDRLDSFISDPELADGGAAMTAYARMQFTEMTELEQRKIHAGLLRYCELDTMAMVLIYEYFKEEAA